MKKRSSHVRCKECKLEVFEDELRDHWFDYHPEKLEVIDRWLGKYEDKVREWERVMKRQEGKSNE